ncbi:hypothetical protein [Xanthomonas hortorum]|uniref:hypothetical protein n=1 Tax=Xanthomonas hortorum TaxID=56454 RepID=UPI000CEDED1B|nr:hypothetical protein [Xanthomonas hortorum]MCE4371806.1 hypothetical protein [Xanthomonas hortorum pv. hederae]PPU80326.1 hypothetical protein XhhCFBP4925_11920 [Xanthomonas hortorum pv. hederae]PUE99727.1 hypothetical protein C7T87_12385 [Xanthomonas hortorum pv. hederae]
METFKWVFVRCWPLSEKCAVDWAAWGTLVGAAVGFVTVVVAVLAWKTSNRATEIAERAADIAQQQHREAIDLRNETARIVGRLVVDEISDLPRRVGRIARAMNRAWAPFEGVVGLLDAQNFDLAMREAQLEMLPTSQSVVDRIHTLPDELGSELAKLTAACTSLRTMSARVMTNSFRDTVLTDHGEVEVVAFKYGPPDFLKMGQHSRRLVRDSADVADKFQKYVGVSVVDYSVLRNEFPVE